MKKKPYLSIIIPAYNESTRIYESLRRLYNDYLDTALHTYEVIVVDDGSTDETADLVEAMRDSYQNLRVLIYPHKGKGYAIRQGMLSARGRWRMMADADFAMPPFELKRLVPSPKQPSAPDIIIAEREQFDFDVVNTPIRWLAGRVFNLAVRQMTGLNIRDTQCGFKVFSERAAVDLFSRATMDGFAIDVEVLMLAQRSRNYTLGSLYVHWVHDPDSRVKLIPDSIKMLRDVYHLAGDIRLRERRAAAENPAQ